MFGPPLTNHLNLIWSALLINELIKNGIDTFFISPGNRNAPLISALVYEQRAVKKTCIDERASGYLALGYAKATGRPGVLVCTSGTAPANYYPAVIEASREDIPLIIISADRPPDLVGSDANQTIVQEGLYGHYCRKTLYLPCPDAAYPLEALLTKLNHVIHDLNGPVHINCAFRDPLTPVESGDSQGRPDLLKKARKLMDAPEPYASYRRSTPIPNLADLTSAIGKSRRGLIVVGRLDTPQDVALVAKLLEHAGWPVFCDIASSLKGHASAGGQIVTLDHPEAIRLIRQYHPDTVLQLGSGLVSKSYETSLLSGSKTRVMQISPRTGLRDPAHRVNLRVDAPLDAAARLLMDAIFAPPAPKAYQRLMKGMDRLNTLIRECVPADAMSFPLIASSVLEYILPGDGLFCGNSIAIRVFDAVLPPVFPDIRVISNRGVSGIEGNIATCVGYAEGSGRRVTAVIGDISFLHDLNSLIILKGSETPVILIVVNNAGGRIFERLPISGYPEILNPLMTTPHTLTFSHVASQFELPYTRITHPRELSRAYRKALKRDQSSLLEVTLSPDIDLEVFKAIQKVRLPG